MKEVRCLPVRPTLSSADEPLVSTLPDLPKFREIILSFVPRLSEKIDAMERAAREEDFRQLAELAHWLKGAGGTVGFAAFTEPASMLEQTAKRGQRWRPRLTKPYPQTRQSNTRPRFRDWRDRGSARTPRSLKITFARTTSY